MAPLSRRLEIAFWTGWVSALRMAQNAPWALVLRVGVFCSAGTLTVIGLAGFIRHGLAASIANRLAQLPVPLAASAVTGSMEIGRVVLPKTTLSTGRPTDTQVNVLFLLVDRLGSPSPQLRGTWLMVSDPQNHKLTFLPLYPSDGNGSRGELSRSFHIDPSGKPSPAFLSLVSRKGVWWHHYLVFDNAALSAMVELAGGVDLGNGVLSGAEALADLPSGREPGEILEGQAVLLEAVCQNAEGLFNTANSMLVSGLVTGADRSDISPEAFQQGWQQISQSGALTCEFPTVLGR